MNPLLQVSPFASDGGELIGRDPREIPAKDWADRPYLVGMKAIRAKCLDCVCTTKEVRKCVQTDCPLWPLRMGQIPKGYKNALWSCSAERDAASAIYPTERLEQQQNPAQERQNDAERTI